MRPLRGGLEGGPASPDRGLPGGDGRSGAIDAVARPAGAGAGLPPSPGRAADARGVPGAVPNAGQPGRQSPGRSGPDRSPGPAAIYRVAYSRVGVPRSGRNPNATP